MSGRWVDDTTPVSKLKCIACQKSQRSLKGWYEHLYKQLCPKCFDKFVTGSKDDKLHVMSKLHWCFIHISLKHGNVSNSELEQKLRKTASECGLIICNGCGKDTVKSRYYCGDGNEIFYCSKCFKERKNIRYAKFSMDRYNCGPFIDHGGGR